MIVTSIAFSYIKKPVFVKLVIFHVDKLADATTCITLIIETNNRPTLHSQVHHDGWKACLTPQCGYINDTFLYLMDSWNPLFYIPV